MLHTSSARAVGSTTRAKVASAGRGSLPLARPPAAAAATTVGVRRCCVHLLLLLLLTLPLPSKACKPLGVPPLLLWPPANSGSRHACCRRHCRAATRCCSAFACCSDTCIGARMPVVPAGAGAGFAETGRPRFLATQCRGGLRRWTGALRSLQVAMTAPGLLNFLFFVAAASRAVHQDEESPLPRPFAPRQRCWTVHCYQVALSAAAGRH